MGAISNPPNAPESDDELRALIGKLAERIADLEVSARKDGNRSPSLDFSDAKLATIAMSMYRARIHRANYFAPSLFGEPAWDMLLDLFIHKVRGARISTTSACLGANVPPSTGLRWIDALEKQALLRRYHPPDDRRLTLVEMTPKGYRLMRQYIGTALTRFEVPMPD